MSDPDATDTWELARHAAAYESLRRCVGPLSDAAVDAFRAVPWFPRLPARTRSWVRAVVTTELTTMVDDIAAPRPPSLQGIFGTAPFGITGQITLDQVVELIRLTVDVVLSAIDDVMDGTSAALLRGDLERYGREVAFAAAAVYAKAAENRGRAGAQRQALLIGALVVGDPEEIAERASGLLPLDLPVRLIGIAPPGSPDLALYEAVRVADRHGVPTCAARHGTAVLLVVPADAAALLDDLGQAGGAVVVSGVAGSVVAAGPAVAAVLSGLRAAPARLGPPGVLDVDDLLPERVLCGDRQAARELVARCYTPLAAAGRGLVRTVDALLAHDGSPDAAARSIPVHVNTLRYRLEKVIALTGRDPRRSADAYVLRMAFALARTGVTEPGSSYPDPTS